MKIPTTPEEVEKFEQDILNDPPFDTSCLETSESLWKRIQHRINDSRKKRIKILVRKSLKMSPGKIAAQAVHATLLLGTKIPLHPLMSVIVLEVNNAQFERAKTEQTPHVIIRDAGYTEVAPGTETCIVFLENDPRN